MSKKTEEKLLTLRTAVLLLIALAIGAAAGALTYLSDYDLPAAVLVGGATFAGTLGFLDKIIE